MKMNFLEADRSTSVCRCDQKILFVDDEEEILNALKRALRSEPYQIYFALDGKAALNLLSRENIHVLVSDMRMPRMDGVQLLEEVAGRYPDIVRMVISGWADADSILEAINNGQIYRYLVKPWDSRELKMTLRQALEMYRLKAERREMIQQLTQKNLTLEKKVMQRAQQVLAVNQQAEIGKYASQIVQKLSEPLDKLSTNIELIGLMSAKQTANMDQLRAAVSTAQGEIAGVKQLVNGIVSHVRQESTAQISLLNINNLIEEEINYFELDPLFRYEIKKEIKLASNLPQIMGDSVQLKQIVHHLIKNAVTAMVDTVEKRLSIETAFKADTIEIRISDTGVGIPPDNHKQIFTDHYTTEPDGEAAGLGLYTVKSLVTAYSGKIDFTSTLEKGTTFRVSLPVGRPTINPWVSPH